MVDIRKLADGIAVSPQLAPEDMPAIRRAGYRAIVCNRPDGEAADRPTHEEIATAARAEGLVLRYLPVRPGTVGDEDVAAFSAALEALPGPVLAYCRTGTRSATLWSLGEARHRPLAEILAATRAAGYDMSGVVRGTGRAP